MIECLKIEDFVITQMFRPYMPSLKDLCHEYEVKYCGRVTSQNQVEENLRKNPELIIYFLNELPETKQRVFNRLRKFGGVKFYRYLDMDNPVIRYVKYWLCEHFEKVIDRFVENDDTEMEPQMNCEFWEGEEDV